MDTALDSLQIASEKVDHKASEIADAVPKLNDDKFVKTGENSRNVEEIIFQ